MVEPIQECKFSVKCWKYYYSKYLLEESLKKGGTLPNRFTMVLLGQAPPSMLHSQTVYMEKEPRKVDGKYIYICPCLYKFKIDIEQNCLEYRKQLKKEGVPLKKSHYKVLREKFSLKQRKEVAEACSYQCVYCHRSINRRATMRPGRNGSIKRLGGTIDHFIPLNKGGCNDFSNLVLACRECNRLKSDNIWKLGCRAYLYKRGED